MPLYFFDIDDGTTLFGAEVGSEFADYREAGGQESRAVAEMTKDFQTAANPKRCGWAASTARPPCGCRNTHFE